MATFRFRAVSNRTNEQLPVEVFLSGKSHGFVPTEPGRYLEISVEDGRTPCSWYAMIWSMRIAKGESTGGTFELMVDEKQHNVEVAAKEV